MIETPGPGPQSFVVEVASNDGYLLAILRPAKRAGSGHRAGRECSQGGGGEAAFPPLVRFFGHAAGGGAGGSEGRCADLVLGNNVLAQVPDLNDFVEGLKILLKPAGRADAGVSPPAPADRTQRVRHHLPRALLVFFNAHYSSHPGERTAQGVRCRRVGDPRRLAPRVRLPGRKTHTTPWNRASRKVIADEERAGLAIAGRLRELRATGETTPSRRWWSFCSAAAARANRWLATERQARARRCCIIAASERI